MWANYNYTDFPIVSVKFSETIDSEEEFNDFMLSDGYKNLFRFPKFVEFVKSITSETN